VGKIIRERLDITPGFDMLQYMEIAGLPRMEQDQAARLAAQAEDWAGALRAYRFDLGRRKGFALLYLDESVENDVEAAWQRSPSEGFSLHNLAIALVMGAAGQAVPEGGRRRMRPPAPAGPGHAAPVQGPGPGMEPGRHRQPPVRRVHAHALPRGLYRVHAQGLLPQKPSLNGLPGMARIVISLFRFLLQFLLFLLGYVMLVAP
jgi:hypothetical protein